VLVLDPRDGTLSAVAEAPPDDGLAAIAAADPVDGSTHVSVDLRIALRFSRPISDAPAIELSADGRALAIRVVLADAGRLAFVHPAVPLLPGREHALAVAFDASRGAPAAEPTVIRFLTAEQARNPEPEDEDPEEWVPDPTADARLADKPPPDAVGMRPLGKGSGTCFIH
jgi:hypothetical protein